MLGTKYVLQTTAWNFCQNVMLKTKFNFGTIPTMLFVFSYSTISGGGSNPVGHPKTFSLNFSILNVFSEKFYTALQIQTLI